MNLAHNVNGPVCYRHFDMNVAIVTFEFESLTKNGGIGTAFRQLAELLVKNGHKVTIVFVPFHLPKMLKLDGRRISREIAALRRKGIRVAMPEVSKKPLRVINDFHINRSLLVYNFLKTQKFDIVHASDNCGLAYVSLLAKKAKLDFEKTWFIIGTHGSPFWVATANGCFSEDSTLMAQLDQRSIEMADDLVSPSAYMLRFLRKNGWKLPRRSVVIPNVNRLGSDKKPTKPKIKFQSSEKALVFFGRLERRKGIYLFTEAVEKFLDKNPVIGKEIPLSLVFLGSQPELKHSLPIAELIRIKLSRFAHRLRLSFIDHLSSDQSLEFLKKNPAFLVCMPSLVDNSPYVVMESIELGLNFLASRSGGQAELIDPKDQRLALCEAKADSLAEAIGKRLSSNPVLVRASRQAENANQNWIKYHAQLKKKNRSIRFKKQKPSSPKVSIILGTNLSTSEPHFILKTLNSVSQQNYPKIELCLASGYSIPETFRNFEIKNFEIAKAKSAWLAAARRATGKYILFLDGGFFPEPSTLKKWVASTETLARGEPSLIACCGIVESTHHLSLHVPDDPLRAVLGQSVGGVFGLWNRKHFLNLARRFSPDLSSDTAIKPFNATAIAAGKRIAFIPLLSIKAPDYNRLLIWDSQNQGSLIRPFEKSFPTRSFKLLSSIAGIYGEMISFRNQCESRARR